MWVNCIQKCKKEKKTEWREFTYFDVDVTHNARWLWCGACKKDRKNE